MPSDNENLLQGFKLAGWQVQPSNGQIESPDGKRDHLTPKAMAVLVCLARQPGQVVDRAEIFNSVWGKLPHSNESLTHCLSELRHAFGDRPADPHFFQTIPKRGYRLIAKVDTSATIDLEAPYDEGTSTGSGFLAWQLRDLKNRKVLQTALGYPVLAWLLVQIVDVVWEYLLQPLGAPEWLVPSFVVLLALGYPVAVFLSWAVDLTPQGMRVTKDDDGNAPVFGIAVVGIATFAITAAALFVYFNSYEPPAPQIAAVTNSEARSTPVQKSIAVLRFLNIGDNPAVGYLADGLTEELIHELTNLRTIRVAARTSVWPFAAKELQVTEIANQLKVEKILEGSVRVDGNQVRVTAQLIDEGGFHLWSETYDRELKDVLDIQKDIAAQVVSRLDIMLGEESSLRLAKKSTIDSTAYDEYLQGRQFLRMPSTADSLASAQTHFENATKLDNRFSLAYAGLCETHLAKYRLTRDAEQFGLAELACHRALTLDGGLAEVYTALGNLYRHFGQNDKALQEYEHALAINPMLEEANFGLARVYQAQGRLGEAEDVLRRGIEIEPGYWGSHFGLGNFLFRQGRFAEAVPYYETVTELDPDYAGGFINLGAAQHWLGNWNAAENAWRRALELDEDATAFKNLGTLYYYLHRFGEAVEMHQMAVDIAPEDHRNWGLLAAAQRYAPGQAPLAAGSYQQALDLVNERLSINPNDAEDLWHLAAYLTNLGDIEAARTAAGRAIEVASESPSAHYFSAIVEINDGNSEKALIQLEKAVQLGYSFKLLVADPQFETIRSSEKFSALENIQSN